MNNKVLALILGGGQGSRLSPLTESRSKPAVPIAGKYRLIDIPISNCINSAINRIFVLTQFNSMSLHKHIKNSYRFDMFSDSFVEILAAQQTHECTSWYQGTADAVRKCMDHFENYEYDYVLILSGDQLYQMDFKHLIDAHVENMADITVATIGVDKKEAHQFGILKTNTEGFVSKFVEKPRPDLLPEMKSEFVDSSGISGENYLASMGIYVFNRQMLAKVLKDGKMNDFGKEIIPQAINKQKVYSYRYDGYWTDIGTISSFFEANLSLTERQPKIDLFDSSKTIYTSTFLHQPSKIFGTVVNEALISGGCIIDAERIERAVVGTRTLIGTGTVITNSIIMGADSNNEHKGVKTKLLKTGIGDNCFINNAILDKNCVIGNNVVIDGGKHLEDSENDRYVIKDGIVVIKKNAVIPDNFIIGVRKYNFVNYKNRETVYLC